MDDEIQTQKATRDYRLSNFINHSIIEVVGEAVKHIPSDFRMEFPDIPWRDIAGMRDA